MRKLTLEEWEKKYIIGPVERFHDRNKAPSRISWDLDYRRRVDNWNRFDHIGTIPGNTHEEWAFGVASRMQNSLALLNNSIPNPSEGARVVAEALQAAGIGVPGRNTKIPGNVKFDASDPVKMTRDIKKVATFFGAGLVGVSKLDMRWIFADNFEGSGENMAGDCTEIFGSDTPLEIPPEYKYVIVIAVEEDYDLYKYFPTWITDAATFDGYTRMTLCTMHVSNFIRNLGYKAIDCSVNEVGLSIPMAMQAGLGEISRMGLLITPNYGPRVRLIKIITDLPLVPDQPIEFGVEKFCMSCMKCAHMCPSNSISFDPPRTEPLSISNAANERKWMVNVETCRIYQSNVKKTCNVCRASCPYNKADTWPHAAVRWMAEHFGFADPLYVKMDDLFGYGKPQKNAAKFWEEWSPRHKARKLL